MTEIKGLSKTVAALMHEEAEESERFIEYDGRYVSSRDFERLFVPWYTLTVQINPKFCDEKTAWLENPCHKLEKLVTEELKIRTSGRVIDCHSNTVKLFFSDEESLLNARNTLSHGKMDDYLLTTGHSACDFYYHVLKKSVKNHRNVERDPTSFYSLANLGQSTFAPLLKMDRDEQLAWKESLSQLFLEHFAMEFCSALNESDSITDEKLKEKSDNIHLFWNKRGSKLQREKNRFFYNIFRSCELLEMRSVKDYGPVDFILNDGINVETLVREPGILIRNSFPFDDKLILPIKYMPFADERIIELSKRLEPYVFQTFETEAKVIYNANLHRDYSGRINVDIEEHYWNDDGPNFEKTKANLLELLTDETNSFGLNWVQLRTTSASGNRNRKNFKMLSKTDRYFSNLIWSAEKTKLPVNNVLSDAIIELGNLNKTSVLVTLKFIHPPKKYRDETRQNYFTYECLLDVSQCCGKVVTSRRFYDYHATEKPENLIPLQYDSDIRGGNVRRMIEFIAKCLKDEEVTIFFDSNEVIGSFGKLLSCPSVKRALYLISDKIPLEKCFHSFGIISNDNFFVPTKIVPLNLRYDSVELNYLALFERRSFSDVRGVGDIPLEGCEWLNLFEKRENNVRSKAHKCPKRMKRRACHHDGSP